MQTAYELELAAAARGHALKELCEAQLAGNLDNVAKLKRTAQALLAIVNDLDAWRPDD